MRNYYVAPGIGSGNGSGPGASQAAPDLTGIPWEPEMSVLLLRGTSLYLPPRNGRSGLFIPRMDGITLSHYGDDEQPPVLHSAQEFNSGWAAVGNGVYSRTGPGTSGVVLYQGQPLPFFDDAIDNAMSLLGGNAAGGYMISSGGSTPTIFVRLPNRANPNNGGVAISHTMIGIECSHDLPVSGLTIDGLELLGFSRQGINLRNVRNSAVRNNVVHATGGDRTDAWYVGGCIQCTGGCDGIDIEHNHVYDCFDSPMSPQIPAGRNGAILQNILYRNNLIEGGWALGGVEIASWAQNTTIRNIRIEKNRIVNGGSGFSGMGDGPRGPLGVIVNANLGPSPSNRFEDIHIVDNYIENCPSGGVYIEHANTPNLEIARNTIRNCGHAGPRGRAGRGSVQQRGGIALWTNQAIDQVVNITANEIADCGKHGISIDCRNATSAGSIVNNTLVNNGADNIYMNVNNKAPRLRNNICLGAGIRKQGSAALQANFNNVHGASSPFSGFQRGSNSTEINPQLVDTGSADFQLAVSSPMIGAGSQVAAQDRLGRAYVTPDLGCYADRTGDPCADLEDLTRQ